MRTKLPAGTVTVIFRNDAPLIHCGDSPAYRSVRIQLTDEQRRQLAMRETSSSGNHTFYEEISRIIMEPDEEPSRDNQ